MTLDSASVIRSVPHPRSLPKASSLRPTACSPSATRRPRRSARGANSWDWQRLWAEKPVESTRGRRSYSPSLAPAVAGAACSSSKPRFDVRCTHATINRRRHEDRYLLIETATFRPQPHQTFPRHSINRMRLCSAERRVRPCIPAPHVPPNGNRQPTSIKPLGQTRALYVYPNPRRHSADPHPPNKSP